MSENPEPDVALTNATMNVTVTVNSGPTLTVTPSDVPDVVSTLNTRLVFAGNVTNVGGNVTTYTCTTYYVTFTQGNLSGFPTSPFNPQLIGNSSNSPVTLQPSMVTPANNAFTLTAICNNTTASYFACSFSMPITTANGDVVWHDPSMIFNPPR